jgi:threonine dehydrogenase-like Zn-dependent dehydrogenase
MEATCSRFVNLDYESAALIEPLSCCFNTWKRLQVTPEDSVIVYGTGPIGTLFLKLAKAYGARQVILVGIINERIKEVAIHGATHTINSLETDVVEEVMRLTDGKGVDVALTCVPVPEVQAQAVEVLALYGRLSLFAGLSKDARVAIDTNRIHYNSLQVSGTTGSSIEDYARSLALVESGRISLKDLVTHRVPLDGANTAFVKALAGESLKTVFLPNGT